MRCNYVKTLYSVNIAYFELLFYFISIYRICQEYSLFFPSKLGTSIKIILFEPEYLTSTPGSVTIKTDIAQRNDKEGLLRSSGQRAAHRLKALH